MGVVVPDLIPAPGFDFRVYMASLGYIKSQAYTVRLYLKKKNEQKLVLSNFTVISEKFGICFMDSSELCLFKDWSFCLRQYFPFKTDVVVIYLIP